METGYDIRVIFDVFLDKDRAIYEDVLKNTKPASVFVELGNIQNRFDQQRIILSENRQALANWLCEGFVTDYNRYKKK